MVRAFTRAAEPATDRPSVSAVSGGWPRRSATTMAHKVRTGARLTITGISAANCLSWQEGKTQKQGRYDCGHMIPSGDMPGAEAQQQSFSLVNIVPQTPHLDRDVWEGIESAVRRLAEDPGLSHLEIWASKGVCKCPISRAVVAFVRIEALIYSQDCP